MRRMLLVDDVPEILEVLHLFVGVSGIEVDVRLESDARAAAALASREAFDVVVSDFRMPNLDGLHVLQAARERNPEGLRVLMTGYNEIPAQPERLEAAGLDAVLHKPLDGDEFVRLLVEFLKPKPATARSG